MRPLFAIAPLALALILFGPTAQAPQDTIAPQSLAQSFGQWMSGERAPAAAMAPAAPTAAASSALASIEAPAAR